MCDILVTCAILKNRKAFFFFSEIVLLHQTIIKEWLFRWKILTPTFILIPFLLNLRKSLTHTFILTSTFIRHLRVCKMIISLGTFFLFFENFDYLGQKWGKWTKMAQIGKKLVCTLSEEQHVIWLLFLVCLWFLVFLVRFSHFFHFLKILILGQR